MTHFNDVLEDLRFIEAHEDAADRVERERELRRHSEGESASEWIEISEFGDKHESD